jgi:hypothetical protein
VVVAVGALYLAIALVTARLADMATSNGPEFWRRSAFVLSGLVLVAHVAYEHFSHCRAARSSAWQAALAVALGAFGLALVANVHDLGSPAGYRPRMLVALVAWPLLTAVPAFIVAVLLAAVLGFRRPQT